MTSLTTLVTTPVERTDLLIGGEWVAPNSTQAIDVENPATEQIIGRVPAGSRRDVDSAVAAARAAIPAWTATNPAQRAASLQALFNALSERADDLAALITAEVGTPARISAPVQVGLALTVLRSYIDLLGLPVAESTIANSLVVREPIGVVGAITPWNYPLYQAMCKLAPALAAGCTVVLKPSELAPLSTFVLGDAALAAGLPPGVVNIVSGDGTEAGVAIAEHPGVDALSFTGSVPTGRAVAALAAATVKRVTLELGGKSANVILDDADLRTAVKAGVNNAYLNAGQTCTAWTRMLVARNLYEDALALAADTADGFVAGNPTDPRTKLGPLVSKAQRDRVIGYIATGEQEGARLISGGTARPDLPTGHYVQATVFADVAADATIAQQEIFGPVLSILPFDSDAAAVEIANNSAFGLHGAVWSADRDRAMQVARRLRTGAVDINGAKPNPLAPFGGYKQSGVGRELGLMGLEEFLETKAIQL